MDYFKHDIVPELEKEDKIILISIRPEYVEKIVRKEKTVELRRTRIKYSAKYMFIYATSPQKNIVALAKIKKIYFGPHKELVEHYKKAAVDPEFIEEYYDGREFGVVIEFGEVLKLKRKITIEEVRDSGIEIPQSYCYLDSKKTSKLLELLS